MLYTDIGDEIIFRNSLWFFYEVAPKLNFSNKFLYEAADTPLIRIGVISLSNLPSDCAFKAFL